MTWDDERPASALKGKWDDDYGRNPRSARAWSVGPDGDVTPPDPQPTPRRRKRRWIYVLGAGAAIAAAVLFDSHPGSQSASFTGHGSNGTVVATIQKDLNLENFDGDPVNVICPTEPFKEGLQFDCIVEFQKGVSPGGTAGAVSVTEDNYVGNQMIYGYQYLPG